MRAPADAAECRFGRRHRYRQGPSSWIRAVKQNVLKIDREREQPVQETRDRWQVIPETINVRELQAGRILEPLERAALDLAARHQRVELAQRVAALLVFEIVLWPE
nr:hypothetical protein [Bradyrhizobium sp. 35]